MRKSLFLVTILLASIFLTLNLSPKVGAQGVSADVDDPIANVTIEEHPLYSDSLENHGTKESGGMNWSVYLVTLSASGDVKVKFDACDSYDPSYNGSSSGISNYTWTVYQDYPWNNPSNDYDGHTFLRTECTWTYTFNNRTADPSGFAENPIRIELQVIDGTGHNSEKVKLYFVVAPEGYDVKPVWGINNPLDGSTQTGDYVWVNGTVISGSENGDVAIEAALDSSILNETIDNKVQQLRDGKFADVRNLGDGYEFSLKLKIDDLYTENGPNPQTIYLKVVEGDGQTWTLYQQITINLVPRGEVLAPNLVGDIHLPGSPWEEFELYEEFDHNWTSNYDSNAKWFLIQFTDTDCGYCWNQAGSMSLLEDDFGDRVTFISVALSVDIPGHDSSREEVVAFQEKTPLNDSCKGGENDCTSRPGDVHDWAYFDDLSLSTLNTWNVQGVPFVVILKPNGIVAWNQAWYPGREVGLVLTELLTVHEVVNDSDGDGVPDSEDPFPYDANETHDDDNDGVGNNSDAFPQDANETHDDDNDGVGNNSDDFPQDPQETTDTDGDGVGDNSDADPDDPTVRIPADLEINVTDTALYVLAAAFLLMAVALVVNRKKKPPEVMGASEVYDSDTIWNER